ncbi:DNAJC15 (predicted) [Pycnogonum litorale]
MTSAFILGGLALAAVGFTGRYLLRNSKVWGEALNQQLKSLPNSAAFANSKYYRGGFDAKISTREAGLILGISPSASAKRTKDAHKRIMLLNHPDRGGSPYLAAKINEAKDHLECLRPGSKK